MLATDARDYIDVMHKSPLKAISDSLRGFITAAPGNKLIAVDFSAIEARVLAFLAGQESVLQVFRGDGKLYEHAATKIYFVPKDSITSDQRLVGKVSSLALGYQGGLNAFQSMARQYGLNIPDELANEIKDRWREANPDIVRYWYALEDAAINATQSPGNAFYVGRKDCYVTFIVQGSFLICRLPSGRNIFYPYPKMKKVITPWGAEKLALNYKGEVNRKFVTKVAYGGLIAENITQAFARDLLRDAIFRFEAAGYWVVMHVHDEIVAEVPENSDKDVEGARALMCQLPTWAAGLPIDADGWEGKRYRK